MARLTNEQLDMLIDLHTKKYITNVEDYNVQLAVNELKKYRDLEEQGLLLKLPVSLGQEVYRVNNIIIPMTVSKISYTRFFEKIYIETIENKFKGNTMYTVEDIGNNIFLTKEAAEKALKEMEGADKSWQFVTVWKEGAEWNYMYVVQVRIWWIALREFII